MVRYVFGGFAIAAISTALLAVLAPPREKAVSPVQDEAVKPPLKDELPQPPAGVRPRELATPEGWIFLENGEVWIRKNDSPKSILKTPIAVPGKRLMVLDKGLVLVPEEAVVTWIGPDKVVARLGLSSETYWIDGRVETKERKK